MRRVATLYLLHPLPLNHNLKTQYLLFAIFLPPLNELPAVYGDEFEDKGKL